MKKLKTPAQRPRKAPSNQTGGTAWGKKLAAEFSRIVQSADMKKLILLNFPYIIAFYMVEKAAWLYRHCNGDSVVDRLMVLFMNFGLAYKSVLPSFHPFDLMMGLVGATALKAVIYFKGKNAKKYRQGEEYGSARWGNQKDIEPFIDPVFENNVILTQTERLMMSGRPKHPKYARNKNVIVIGGSGSGKTRFYVKPNLMQMPQKVSYVVTDPKGTIIIECGKMLSDAGYKIKILNTINFKKSMRYNPFHYIRSEKDILKLVNTIIANTKGDGEKSGEDFWVKAERLLYCALIGYIWYEAPEEEQNFSTLLEFINASEAREDDENFKNAVDELFEELEKDKPAGLLERERGGFSAPNRLYVKVPRVPQVQFSDQLMAGNPTLIEPENRPTDGQKTDLMMVGKPSPNQTTINNLTESQTKGVSGEPPAPYGRYQNIFLSQTEYDELQAEYPDRLERFIEEMSRYLAANGKSYQNYAAALRIWAGNDKKKAPKKGIPDYSCKEGESL